MGTDEPTPSKGMSWLATVLHSPTEFLIVVFYYVAIFLACIIGFNFIIRMFLDFKTDTTSLSNGAFVIVAAIAALAFSCARSLGEETEKAKQFSLAGQKLFYAALMFILASLLKYSLLSLKESPLIKGLPSLVGFFDIVLGLLAAVLFGVALGFASLGLENLLELLEDRVTNFPSWKKKFGIRGRDRNESR